MRGRPRTGAGIFPPELTVDVNNGLEELGIIFNFPKNDSSVLNGLLQPNEAANVEAIRCIVCVPLGPALTAGRDDGKFDEFVTEGGDFNRGGDITPPIAEC